MQVGRRQQGVMTPSVAIDKIFLHVRDLLPVLINLISQCIWDTFVELPKYSQNLCPWKE